MRCAVFLWWVSCQFCMAQNPAAAPLIFKESKFDFGSVPEATGPVMHRFYFYNRAVWPVSIRSVSIDCGATVLDWTKTPVNTNKGGVVVVTFDPVDKAGYFEKNILVRTDWFNYSVKLQITGNVLSRHYVIKWPHKSGNLKMQQRTVFFKKAYINRATYPVDFPLLNDGEVPMVISKIVAPPYLQVQVPLHIGAHQAVNMSVKYEATKRKLGFHRDVIELRTNDSPEELKKIPVVAMVEEYFPPLSDEEFFKAPIAVLDTARIDFGMVKTPSAVSHVVLKNMGSQELRIRDIVPNHSSISIISAYKKVLQKNDTTWLKFLFTPYGQTGKLHKAATLFTNDPRSPTQNILMTMECQ